MVGSIEIAKFDYSQYIMKVTGFTFIKNALKYDYPIIEAITSILPICDNFIVAVGESEDETLELIKSIDPSKIEIVQTKWDKSLREGGHVLAVETDKAFKAISKYTDWAFYIQGDEVVHEKYLPTIKAGMIKYLNDPDVDGLLFNYAHFYGSYDYIGAAENWYPHEIRIIRNNPMIYSYKDAQGFRKEDDKKLKVKPIDAYIYHYGWVKEPKAMQKKQEDFNKLWHNDEWVDQHVVKAEAFDYLDGISTLYKFEGTHPRVMLDRIERVNWKFGYDISFNKRSLKYRLKGFIENKIGFNLSHKNYIKI
ncbi:MAG: hypothetical protein ACI837_000142 [Crocinitomicaceae bacterium]